MCNKYIIAIVTDTDTHISEILIHIMRIKNINHDKKNIYIHTHTHRELSRIYFVAFPIRCFFLVHTLLIRPIFLRTKSHIYIRISMWTTHINKKNFQRIFDSLFDANQRTTGKNEWHKVVYFSFHIDAKQ